MSDATDVDVEVSPRGAVRVEYEVFEMRMSHWVRTPRVIRVSDGATIVDLWGTTWDGGARFGDDERTVTLSLRCYPGDTEGFDVVIDTATATFRFADEATPASAPVHLFLARLNDRHVDRMIEKALADARARRARMTDDVAARVVARLEAVATARREGSAPRDQDRLAPFVDPAPTDAASHAFAWLLERIDDAVFGDDDDDDE